VSDMNRHSSSNEAGADGELVVRRSAFRRVVVDLTANEGDPVG
jgi:hypothetical protein